MNWASVTPTQRQEQISQKYDCTGQTDATQHAQNKTDKTLQHQPELAELTAVQGEQDFPRSCISLDLNWYLWRLDKSSSFFREHNAVNRKEHLCLLILLKSHEQLST